MEEVFVFDDFLLFVEVVFSRAKSFGRCHFFSCGWVGGKNEEEERVCVFSRK